jgi:hypothetical protein
MDAMAIPIVGMLIPIVVVPTALGIKLARQMRELEHKERMRALELGRTLPKDEAWWTPPRLAAALAVGVPIGVFYCAAIGGARQEIVWGGATGVSVTAVICGTVLAGIHFTRRARAEELAQGGYAKPVVDDADAYDVVGRRG